MWALGVKEVWRVAQPLRRVIHTMGWPLRAGAQYREFGGSFIYPMGDDMVTIGMVVGLDYRDAELSVHDLLQELKTHPHIRRILEGGERVQWGAKTIPEGGFVALPKRFHAPGLLLVRRRRRPRQRAGAEGNPLRDRVGPARGRGGVAHARRGRRCARRSRRTTTSLRESFIWSDLREVRNMRQAFGRGFYRRRRARGRDDGDEGQFPPGDAPTERDAEQALFRPTARRRIPAPDGKLTFDKLSSVFVSGNRTRDDQPNHIRVQTRGAARARRDVGRMCPAQVYEVGEADGDGTSR